MYYGKIALESPLSPNEITDVISSALPKRWVRDYSEMFYGKVKGNYFRLYHPQYDKMGAKPIFFPVMIGKVSQNHQGATITIYMRVRLAGFLLLLMMLIFSVVGFFVGITKMDFMLLLSSVLFLLGFVSLLTAFLVTVK